MDTPTNSNRQYPVACPSCAEAKGYPVQVKTLTEHPGSIEVKLRCRDCQHEWVEVVTSHD
jgi:ribosomal protein S27E